MNILRGFCLIALAATLAQPAQADCFSPANEVVDSGFIDCIREGNRYEGTIDQLTIDEVKGAWAHICKDMTVRIRLVRSDFGKKTTAKSVEDNLTGAKSGERSVIGVRRIGSTYHIYYRDMNGATYSAYVFASLPDGSIQLYSLTELKDGEMVEKVNGGMSVETGKFLPRLYRCEQD